MPDSPEISIKLSPIILKRHEMVTKNRENVLSQNTVIKHRWKIQEKINAGIMSDIYRAYDLELKKDVVIKADKLVSSSLGYEANILKRLSKFQHFCKHMYHEISQQLNYLVMELQGKNICELRRDFGFFSLSTTLRIGLQMLCAIETLHKVGYVHCNVSPSNFVAGRDNCRDIYLLDFSMAENYLIKQRNYIPKRSRQGFKGTYVYASPHIHMGIDLNRRDDLWSLLYTLISCRVILPWAEDTRHEEILKKKQQRIEYLITLHLGSDFVDFKKHLASLGYKDDPDYELLKSCFARALNRFSISDGDIYDWEMYTKKIWKVLRTQSTQKSSLSLPLLAPRKQDDPNLRKSADEIYTFRKFLSDKRATEVASKEIGDTMKAIELSFLKLSGTEKEQRAEKLTKRQLNLEENIWKNYVVAYHTVNGGKEEGNENQNINSCLSQVQNQWNSATSDSGQPQNLTFGYSESGLHRKIEPYIPNYQSMPSMRLVEVKSESEKRSLEVQAIQSDEMLDTFTDYGDEDELNAVSDEDDDEEEMQIQIQELPISKTHSCGNLTDTPMKPFEMQMNRLNKKGYNQKDKRANKAPNKAESKNKPKQLKQQNVKSRKSNKKVPNKGNSISVDSAPPRKKLETKQKAEQQIKNKSKVQPSSSKTKVPINVKSSSSTSIASAKSVTSEKKSKTNLAKKPSKLKITKKVKKETKFKADEKLKYMASSLAVLQLPENEIRHVPPMPQERSVYRPSYTQMLDPIPEGKLLVVNKKLLYYYVQQHLPHAYSGSFMMNAIPSCGISRRWSPPQLNCSVLDQNIMLQNIQQCSGHNVSNFVHPSINQIYACNADHHPQSPVIIPQCSKIQNKQIRKQTSNDNSKNKKGVKKKSVKKKNKT